LIHIDKEYLLKKYGGDVEYTVDDWFKFLEEEDAKAAAQQKSSSSSSV